MVPLTRTEKNTSSTAAELKKKKDEDDNDDDCDGEDSMMTSPFFVWHYCYDACGDNSGDGGDHADLTGEIFCPWDPLTAAFDQGRESPKENMAMKLALFCGSMDMIDHDRSW